MIFKVVSAAIGLAYIT